MTIEELRFSLKHLPGLRVVWLKDGQFYTAPITGGEEVDLMDDPLKEIVIKTNKLKKEKIINGTE